MQTTHAPNGRQQAYRDCFITLRIFAMTIGIVETRKTHRKIVAIQTHSRERLPCPRVMEIFEISVREQEQNSLICHHKYTFK